MENIFSKEIKVNIGINEDCPCNSGKNYGDCCKNKNHEYMTLGKNHKGVNIVFNNSMNMETYDKISNFALENIFSLKEDEYITISKGEELIHNIYSMVDEGISQFETYAPCTKGCSRCCSLYLECTAIEAEAIRRHIKSTKTEEEIKEIEVYITTMKEKMETTKSPHDLEHTTLHDMYYNYLKEDTPCMFLKEDKSCGIYTTRPLRCRGFIVFTSSDKCSLTKEIVTPKLPPIYIGNLAIEHLSMKVGRYKSLTYVNENNEAKPIKRCLLQWFNKGLDSIDRTIE